MTQFILLGAGLSEPVGRWSPSQFLSGDRLVTPLSGHSQSSLPSPEPPVYRNRSRRRAPGWTSSSRGKGYRGVCSGHPVRPRHPVPQGSPQLPGGSQADKAQERGSPPWRPARRDREDRTGPGPLHALQVRRRSRRCARGRAGPASSSARCTRTRGCWSPLLPNQDAGELQPC